MPKAKVVLTGCAACSLASNKEECFVKPQLPMINGNDIVPEVIVIGDFPTRLQGEGLGESGKILQSLLKAQNAEALIINAANCYNKNEPDIKVIRACRDAYVNPALSKYPNVPVLALGSYAASSILGGRRSEGKISGTVRIVDGREVYFSYSPLHYLKEGKKEWILEHIEVMLNSCLTSIRNRTKVDYVISPPPKEFFDCETIYIDLETTGVKGPWYGSEITIAGLANDQSDLVYIVPFKHDQHKSLADSLEPLSKFKGRVVNHNLNFDLCFLNAYDIFPKLATFGDTQIFERCCPIVEQYGDIALKWLLKQRYGVHGYEAAVHTKLFVDKVTTHQIPLVELAEYCAFDVIGAKTLDLEQQLFKHSNLHIYNLTMDYFRYIVDMEINGLYVDKGIHEKLARENKEEILSRMMGVSSIVKTRVLVDEYYSPFITSKMSKCLVTKETLQKGDTAFNPRSHQQIKEFLFSAGITLPDTQEETLELFKNKHPLISVLSGLRKVEKLGGTYYEGYRPWIDEAGLIHSSIGVQGTESGRCNSSNPNIQNTPAAARAMCVSRFKDGLLISPDLSALEYRIIAHVSQDTKLLDIFKTGKDIHRCAASDAFKVDYEVVTKEQRREGKTINYAGVYGCGPDKFFSLLGREDMDLYRRSQRFYPGVNRWKSRLLDRLHTDSTVTTIFGRVREFEGIITSNIEREAINWSIQSAGHDIFKIFLMAVMDKIREERLEHDCLLVNENHDSFILDCSLDGAMKAGDIVLEHGQNLNSLIEASFGVKMTVPILSEVKESAAWR